MARAAQREDPLLGPQAFLVAACPAEGDVGAMLVEGLAQCLGLHDVGVEHRPVGERRHPRLQTFLVGMDDQLHARLATASVRKAYMSRNFHVVSMCSSGNGGAAG